MEQLWTGPKEFTIPESCGFVQSTCKNCTRQSYKVKYFESSKFEHEVDVGRCIGQCGTKG